MAVRMALAKGPTLQKLLVFTLLTLTGLGSPPPLAEADVKCYKCPNGCSGGEGQEESCPSGVCQMGRQRGSIVKDCGNSELLAFIKCLQKEVQQTGSCVKLTLQQLIEIQEQEKCKAGGGGSSQRALEGRQGGGEYVEMCACDTDLCNTNSQLPGGPTGPVGPTEPGESKIECYCKNQHLTPQAGLPKTCQGDGPTQCEPSLKACNIIKGEGGAIQGCDPDGYFGQGKDVFECVQKKLPGGSGNCVKGTKEQLFGTMAQCGASASPIGRSGGQKLVVEICTCKTNLCNSDGNTGTGGIGGDGKSTPKENTGTGAGGVVISSTNFEITGVLVSLLATIRTNGLF